MPMPTSQSRAPLEPPWCCSRRMLVNLRKLSLFNVAFSLPALQTVAMRLRQLSLHASRLQGSADGFLAAGWTALTSLSLECSCIESDVLPPLHLPALEEMDMTGFRHRGGVLQLDQLAGGCPQVSRLSFPLSDADASLGPPSKGGQGYISRSWAGSRACASWAAPGTPTRAWPCLPASPS